MLRKEPIFFTALRAVRAAVKESIRLIHDEFQIRPFHRLCLESYRSKGTKQ